MPKVEDYIWQLAIDVTGSDKIKQAQKDIQDLYKSAGKNLPDIKNAHEAKIEGNAKGQFEALTKGVQGFDAQLGKLHGTLKSVSDAGAQATASMASEITTLTTSLAKDIANIPSAIVNTSFGDTINGWAMSAQALGMEINKALKDISSMGSQVKETDAFKGLRKEAEGLEKQLQHVIERKDAVVAAHYVTGENKIANEAQNVSLYIKELEILKRVRDELANSTNNDEDKAKYYSELSNRIDTVNEALAVAVGKEREYQQELINAQNDPNKDQSYIDALAEKWTEARVEVHGLRTELNELNNIQQSIKVDPKAIQAIHGIDRAIENCEKRIQGADNAQRRWLEHEGNIDASEKYNNYAVQANQIRIRLVQIADEMDALEKSGGATNQTEVMAKMAEKLQEVKNMYAELTQQIDAANRASVELENSETGGHLGLEASANNAKRLADGFNDTNKIAQQVNAHIQAMKLPEEHMSRQSKKIQRHLLDVEAKMKELELTKVPTEEFNNLENAIKDDERQLEHYNRALELAKKLGQDPGSTGFRRLKENISEANKQLIYHRGLRQAMMQDGSAFESGADTDAYERLASRRDELQQNLNDSLAKDTERRMTSIANIFTKSLKAGLKGFSGTVKKEFNGIKSAVKGVVSSMAHWRKDQTSITDQAKAMYNTFNSFWRMLKTRIKRKLVGAVFNDITGTIGEIARIEPRFNSALSGFIVSARTLGAQIIASFEPIASIVLPILSQFLDYLTQGASQLAQFISRATGNTKFIEATKGQFDYAASLDKTTSSTKKATKAAKEYENTVMSFDQLHKLNGTNDESSLDEALGLDGVNLDHANDKVDAVNELGERLWDALSKHDFAEAGRVMGDAVNMGFSWLGDKFGWIKNGERFSKWLQNTIDGLNAFVDELDPETIGNAIGDISNVFIHLFEQWTDPEEGFDYYNFGKKLGGILANAVKTADWDVLGEGIVQGIQGSVRFVNGFMEGGEGESIFATLGHAMSDLFTGMIGAFNPEDWSDLISGVVNGIFEFIGTALDDPTKAEELGNKIGDTINLTFQKLDADKISGGINALTEAFTTLIESALERVEWGSVLGKVGEILKKVNWLHLGETIGIMLIPAVLSGITSMAGSLLGSGAKALIKKIFVGAGAGGAEGAGGGASLLSKASPVLGKLLGGLAAFEAGGAIGVNGSAALGLMDKKWAQEYNKNWFRNSFIGFEGAMLNVASLFAPTWAADKAKELRDKYNLQNAPADAGLYSANQQGRTQNASLGYRPDVGTYSQENLSAMSTAIAPAMEQSVGTKLQEISDSMTAIPETALSKTDSDAYATTLIDGIAEATALPTDSVAGQNSEEFRTFLSEDFRGTVMEAALMLAQEIANKDMTVELDRQVVARSVNSYNNNQNKRQNPNWATAY